jgi:hypothetical protein
MTEIQDIVPVLRTIDDHIDTFEAIGVLLKGKNSI